MLKPRPYTPTDIMRHRAPCPVCGLYVRVRGASGRPAYHTTGAGVPCPGVVRGKDEK